MAAGEAVALWHQFSTWVWDESFWFPPGVNWTTLDGAGAPRFSDLKYSILLAFPVLFLRICFEWSIARPFGIKLGIRDTHSELTSWLDRSVRWIRCRLNGGKPVSTANGTHAAPTRHVRNLSGAKRIHLVHNKSTLDKFSESFWRFIYYFGIFVYGTVVLWDKPWVWDTKYCWYGYPFQPVSREIWWYYMIELSFYWSLTFSQFFDVQRKDFWVNFVHHIATILLMSFSWSDNFVRVGTLVLLVHDAADFWLEAGKMARYGGKKNVCNAIFVVFILVWTVSRLVIFPFRLIWSTAVEAPALVGFCGAYYVFNCLLLLLQALHIYWSYMIFRVIIVTLRYGEPDDVRSDEDDDEEDDDHEDLVPRGETPEAEKKKN